jgi:two-component system, cell cycle sensor histidine kinase PleC
MPQVPAPKPFCRLDFGAGGGSPTLLIDPHASVILDANPAALDVLDLGEAGDLPLALDCAMPAIQRLRSLSARGWQGDRTRLALTFWTPRGCLHSACDVEGVGNGSALVVMRMSDLAKCKPMAGVPAGTAARAKLAHELRTPFGAIVAYAEVLKEEHFGPLGSERYASYARNIHESARHAMGVVERMLEGECEASGEPQLTFADIDPARVIESCLVVAAPLAERAGLLLSTDVPARLPRIVADAVSVRQMLLNLLANAIKFARQGDRVRVSVACDGEGPLRISVTDTGPGIDDSAGAVRSSNAAKPGKAGLGLGLPLTRSLAKANGAVLAIDSEAGRGTCATISFGKDRLVPV